MKRLAPRARVVAYRRARPRAWAVKAVTKVVPHRQKDRRRLKTRDLLQEG